MGGAAREACPTTSMVFALAEQASFHQAEAFYSLFGGFPFSFFLFPLIFHIYPAKYAQILCASYEHCVGFMSSSLFDTNSLVFSHLLNCSYISHSRRRV